MAEAAMDVMETITKLQTRVQRIESELLNQAQLGDTYLGVDKGRLFIRGTPEAIEYVRKILEDNVSINNLRAENDRMATLTRHQAIGAAQILLETGKLKARAELAEGLLESLVCVCDATNNPSLDDVPGLRKWLAEKGERK